MNAPMFLGYSVSCNEDCLLVLGVAKIAVISSYYLLAMNLWLSACTAATNNQLYTKVWLLLIGVVIYWTDNSLLFHLTNVGYNWFTATTVTSG